MADTEPDIPDDGTSALRAWHDFCEQMRGAGDWVFEHCDDDPLDRVEGLRYLTRLVRGGLESFVESADPGRPEVRGLPHQVKIGVDNPDSFYQSANLHGRHTYRLTGTRGTVHYLSINAYGGNFGAGRDRIGQMGRLDDSNLMVDANGRFEAILSATPHEGNWLELGDEAVTLVVRQFHLDRDAEEPARLRIECLDVEEPPPVLTAPTLVRALGGASAFVTGTMERFHEWVERFRRERPNTLDFNQQAGGGWGDNVQLFRHGYFTLAEGEALVIRFTPPPCFYWNFQLCNWWEESLDYRHHPVTVNKHSAVYGDDGSVELVVAHQDPGVANWLSTAGHRHGGMGLRWNQAEYDVEPEVAIVSLVDLEAAEGSQ
ncbi:MAG: hypothetical protein CL441_04925 [Acidimicrobiaceae bacterium]|nr:hypothetical protein [Acidimicrobiaceae bacterium]